MNILLDSYALIEFIQGSAKGEKVREQIINANTVSTTTLNLYEVKYRLAELQISEYPEEEIKAITRTTNIIPITENVALIASDIKQANRKMGAVDCNTLAAARVNNLTVITGDVDFPKDKDIIFV